MMLVMRKSYLYDGCHMEHAASRAERKRNVRGRILDVAARHLRRDGVDGAAIGPIMREAGLTHGAFYAHFGDKQDFMAAAFAHAISSGRKGWLGDAPDESWLARMKRLAAGYLTRWHRDNPGAGCAFATAASDGGRADESFRSAFEAELLETLEGVCAPFRDGAADDERRLDDAIALLALCVGGLSLSRAVADKDLSDRILLACRTAVAVRAK